MAVWRHTFQTCGNVLHCPSPHPIISHTLFELSMGRYLLFSQDDSDMAISKRDSQGTQGLRRFGLVLLGSLGRHLILMPGLQESSHPIKSRVLALPYLQWQRIRTCENTTQRFRGSAAVNCGPTYAIYPEKGLFRQLSFAVRRNQHLIICQLAGKKSGTYAEARQTGGSAHRLTYLRQNRTFGGRGTIRLITEAFLLIFQKDINNNGRGKRGSLYFSTLRSMYSPTDDTAHHCPILLAATPLDRGSSHRPAKTAGGKACDQTDSRLSHLSKEPKSYCCR
ncbi:hypothetical protein CCUS01_13783 [Colletotrichum cuscutae]|uniref:Uncharacterized protein n=1 Tax=Colletotrichum cuscutae TaxID=1209917 RepID=A0AAI9YB75_9PEZI|nr:hypothetical protein CCUS01_13783 [Colletotrichum cuscutae]